MALDDGVDPQDTETRPRAVSDLFRKVLVSGVGALFMTEEGIRSMVKELKLPKEIIGAVIAQADRTKSDVVRVVGSEVRSFLESSTLRKDLLELATQLRLEVRAEIGIKHKDDDSTVFEPTVKGRVDVRRREKKAPPKRKRTTATATRKKSK